MLNALGKFQSVHAERSHFSQCMLRVHEIKRILHFKLSF